MFPADTLEAAAAALFNVRSEDPQVPVAAFALLGDTGRAPAGYCLCADPVHLRTDTHGLVLFDASTFPLCREDRAALRDTVADFLHEDGWQLQAGRSGRWYLLGEEQQDLDTTPLSRLRGRSVAGFLPQGRDAPDWRRRCNEIQMLMHAHPVNRRRAEQGLPLVNSLWVWGGGVLPEPQQAGVVHRVMSNHPAVQGLGTWNGAHGTPLPERAAEDWNDPGQDGHTLVTLEALDAPAAYEDIEHWNAVLEGYERDWFQPLLTALARRRLRSLELLPLNGRRYHLSSADLLKFWKGSVSWREVLALQ